MTLAMTTTAMADLSERARRVLELQKKYRRYGIGIADIDDAWDLGCQSADLIRELLEENERLRDGIKQIRAAVKSEQTHYLKRYQNEKSAYREGGSDVADAIMSAVDVTIAHITAKVEQIASLVGDMEPVEHNTRLAGPTPLRGRVTRRQD